MPIERILTGNRNDKTPNQQDVYITPCTEIKIGKAEDPIHADPAFRTICFTKGELTSTQNPSLQDSALTATMYWVESAETDQYGTARSVTLRPETRRKNPQERNMAERVERSLAHDDPATLHSQLQSIHPFDDIAEGMKTRINRELKNQGWSDMPDSGLSTAVIKDACQDDNDLWSSLSRVRDDALSETTDPRLTGNREGILRLLTHSSEHSPQSKRHRENVFGLQTCLGSVADFIRDPEERERRLKEATENDYTPVTARVLQTLLQKRPTGVNMFDTTTGLPCHCRITYPQTAIQKPENVQSSPSTPSTRNNTTVVICLNPSEEHQESHGQPQRNIQMEIINSSGHIEQVIIHNSVIRNNDKVMIEKFLIKMTEINLMRKRTPLPDETPAKDHENPIREKIVQVWRTIAHRLGHP